MIKVNNCAEKLAALYFFAAKAGIEVSEYSVQEALAGRIAGAWVGISNDGVDRAVGFGCLLNGRTEIPFSKLAEIDTYQTIVVKLNDSYTASISKGGVQVGCQIFPLDVITELNAALNKIKN